MICCSASAESGSSALGVGRSALGVCFFFVDTRHSIRGCVCKNKNKRLRRYTSPIAALPSILVTPSSLTKAVGNPFPRLKLVRCPRFDSCAPAHIDLSVFPSMSRASPRLHSHCCPSQLYLLSRKSLSSIPEFLISSQYSRFQSSRSRSVSSRQLATSPVRS